MTAAPGAPSAAPLPVPLGSLTDAELVALARPRSRVGPRPVLPVWSRATPDQRAATVLRARRSLVARGLVDLTADGRALLRRDLRAVLALRASAPFVVAVVRTAPHGVDHWYAHVVDDAVLLEQVTGDGEHRFALAPFVALPGLVVGALLHPGDRGPGGADPEDETDWLRADLELRHPDRATRRAWVSGPGGTWRITTGRPHRTIPEEPDAVRRWVTAALGRPGRGVPGDAA